MHPFIGPWGPNKAAHPTTVPGHTNARQMLNGTPGDLCTLRTPAWPMQDTCLGICIGYNARFGRTCMPSVLLPLARPFTPPQVDLLPTCRELGIGVLAYSPLSRGLLTGGVKVCTQCCGFSAGWLPCCCHWCPVYCACSPLALCPGAYTHYWMRGGPVQGRPAARGRGLQCVGPAEVSA